MAPRDRFLIDLDDESSFPIQSLATSTDVVVVANNSATTTDAGLVAAAVLRRADDDEHQRPAVTGTTKSQPAQATTTTARYKKVTFHLVHVREYGRVVGDHPEVKVGPPIALSWQFVTQSPQLLEAYETERGLLDNNNSRRSTAGSLDRLTSIARKNLLFDYGFNESDFRIAEHDANLVREQRSITKQEIKKEKDASVLGGSSDSDYSTGRRDDDDRTTKLHNRIGRSFRKNFMSSLSVAAKAMATPTMIPV